MKYQKDEYILSVGYNLGLFSQVETLFALGAHAWLVPHLVSLAHVLEN